MEETTRPEGSERLEVGPERFVRPETGEKSLERQIRAFHWIRLLSELPGRRAGSPQEQEAGRRVEAWLHDLGVEDIRVEPVAARPGPGALLAAHAGLAGLGCLVGGVLGFALTAFAALSFRREVTGGSAWLSRLLPARDSRNVVARVGASRPRRRVVMVAPLDSPRAGRFFSRRAGWLADPRRPRPRAWALPAGLLGASVVVTAALALGAEGALVGAARLAALLGLGLVSLAGLEWARAAASPGAGDNASGVAALLTATEQLAAQLPPDVELCCAATGAAQVGSCGMHALLEAHPEWLDGRSVFVDFECLGGGQIQYARSEGGLSPVSYPPMLGELSRRVAASGAYGSITPGDLGFDSDGGVAARKGAEVLTLVALGAEALPVPAPGDADRPDRIEMEIVIRAADFGCCVISAHLRGDAEPLAYV